ncbi:hypothetical protein HYZ80_03135 [Candidatus Parcubacteria bacterium]|nr:hypothetical protein [Candidatus Parcubacteria bacterium]
MSREIPNPWTESHEQALADFIKFAYEEAKRNNNGETFLPEEQEAYEEAMRRVEALGVLERPEAKIKLMALDRRLKFLQRAETVPPPPRAKDSPEIGGQPDEEPDTRRARRAGSVPRGLPVEPLPSPAVIETTEGTPAADAAEIEETSDAAGREAPPAEPTPAATETSGEKPVPTPAPRRPKRWEKTFAELTAPPKTPEEKAALENALSDLANLPTDTQALLEKEAEIFLSNHEIPVTPENRAQMIREASLLILRRYPDWSRERVVSPPAPAPAEQRRGKREYPENPPELQTEIETFLQGLTPEQSAQLQNEIRSLAGRTANGDERAAREHIIHYYSLNAVKQIAGPETPPAPEPKPEPAPPPTPEPGEAPPAPSNVRNYEQTRHHWELVNRLAQQHGISQWEAYDLAEKEPDVLTTIEAETPAPAADETRPQKQRNQRKARGGRVYDEGDLAWDEDSLRRARARHRAGTAQPPAEELTTAPTRPAKPDAEEAADKAARRAASEMTTTVAADEAAMADAAARPEPEKPALSPDEDEIHRMVEEARAAGVDMSRAEAIQRLLTRPDLYPTSGPTRTERLQREEQSAQADEIRRVIAANADLSVFTEAEARTQASRLLEQHPDEFPNDGGPTRTQRQQTTEESHWALLQQTIPPATPERPEPTQTEPVERQAPSPSRAADGETAYDYAAAVTEAASEGEERARVLAETAQGADKAEARQPGDPEIADALARVHALARSMRESAPPSDATAERRRERPKAGRVAAGVLKHVGAAAAKTAGSLLGVKFFYDVFAWGRQRGKVRRERREVQAALAEMAHTLRAERRAAEERTALYRPDNLAYTEAVAPTVKRFKEALEQAQYLPAHEKKEFRKRLASIMAERKRTDEELRQEDMSRADKLSRLYLNTKISGYQVAREALNTALVLGGMPVLRGAAYAATAAAERWAKAGRAYEKAAWDGEHSASFRGKRIAQAKDLFLTSTAETLHGLTGGMLRSKEARGRRTGLERTGEFFQAASKLAIAYGIGGAAVNALLERPPVEVVEELLTEFEGKGIGAITDELSEKSVSGAAEAAAQNWWKNFNDTSERFTAMRFDRADLTRGPHASGSLSDEVRHIEATSPPSHDEAAYGKPEGMGEEAIKQFQETPPTVPAGLSEAEIEQAVKLSDQQNEALREAARAVGMREWHGATEPSALTEAIAQAPAATIEQGGNVWDAAKSLVGAGEGKISAKEFAAAWEQSVQHLPDLVHPGDVVKFVSAAEGAPAHFEVIPESGLATGTAKDLADIYRRLGKEVPEWLQEKIAPSAEITKQVEQIAVAPPDEFSSALDELHRDFRQADLIKQEEVLQRIHDVRQRLEYEWHNAADNQARESAIFEEMQRLDATRQRLTLSPDFGSQQRAFSELLKSVELPSSKLAELKTLTVERLLAEKDSPAMRDFGGLARRVQDYLKITPSRERPLQMTVETFLKKFIVGGKAIEPPTAV